MFYICLIIFDIFYVCLVSLIFLVSQLLRMFFGECFWLALFTRSAGQIEEFKVFHSKMSDMS